MKGSQAGALILTKPEVLVSVASLYEDGLRPFGRVLLKRLRERAAARYATEHGLPVESVDPEDMPRLNPRHLRKVCETCRQLRVVSEEGREFSVTLAAQPSNFLDVCSAVDPYPEEFWQEFACFLDDDGEELQMPGGRYACARALLIKRLPLLQEYSLAHVCHIVHLAINCRRLLGYNREGWLVAYMHSEAWIKEQCASAQSSTGQEKLPVVSWEEARTLLRELLHPYQQAGITLSNLKRLFRVTFERELSETVLGHVRLLDLMKDPRMAEVCVLSGHGNGQTMVKAIPAVTVPALQLPSPAVPPGMWTMPMQPVQPIQPMQMCHVPMMTMIHVCAGISTPHDSSEALLSPGSSPRGSLCGGFGFSTGSIVEAFPVSRSDALMSPGSSPRGSLCGAHSFATESTAEGFLECGSERDEDDAEECRPPWAVNVKNTFIDVTMHELDRVASPSARQRRRSTPAACRSPVSRLSLAC